MGKRVTSMQLNPLFKAKPAYGELFDNDQEKRDAACEDVKEWMGERFELLIQTIQTPYVKNNRLQYRTPHNLRMQMAFFCAFEGYPVKAILQRYHPRSIRMFGVDCRGRNVVPIKAPE